MQSQVFVSDNKGSFLISCCVIAVPLFLIRSKAEGGDQGGGQSATDFLITRRLYFNSGMSCLSLACLGHWIKTLVLGIAANAFDVWTDGTNGKTFLEGRRVNRSFEENITVPDSCFQVTVTECLVPRYSASSVPEQFFSFCISPPGGQQQPVRVPGGGHCLGSPHTG